jgi:hypothetical protein
VKKDEAIRNYADSHQQFQKVRSDWPALTTALRFISEGDFALGTEKKHFNEWRAVHIYDKELPYNGLEIISRLR